MQKVIFYESVDTEFSEQQDERTLIIQCILCLFLKIKFNWDLKTVFKITHLYDTYTHASIRVIIS